MKLKKDYVVHRAGEESYLVPVGGAEFAGVIHGNELFGDILSLLAEETDEQTLTDALAEQIDAPREKLAADAARVIRELREIGALEE